jgi:hypothetical protein
MSLAVYKFLVPGDRFYPSKTDPDLAFRGCVAVTVAESPEAARERLIAYAAENGMDSRWLEVARVIVIPLVPGAVCAWAQT